MVARFSSKIGINITNILGTNVLSVDFMLDYTTFMYHGMFFKWV
jgi:hypothetical protein